MIQRPPQTTALRAWLAVIVWTAILYVTIPFARQIQRPMRDRWGSSIFTWIVAAAGLIALGFLVKALLRLRHRLTRWNLACLALVILLFAVWGRSLHRSRPEEALHFVQYGLLGFLLFRAWAVKVRHPLAYWGSLLSGSLLGTLDEVIQWISPERYFEFRDIFLNAGSTCLVLLGIAGGLAPRYLTERPGRRAVGCVYGLGLLLLAVWGACLLNTPETQARYTARSRLLRRITRHAHVMTEYGYLYRDAEAGAFKSRLSPEALARMDREQGGETAAILDEFQRHERYAEFLERYPAATAPFLHEARVHLFRRDRHRHVAATIRERNPAGYRRFLTIAYRENQIMERYFPTTLAASAYTLRPETLAYMRAHLDEDMAYVSAVSRALITRFGPWQAAIGSVALMLLWTGAFFAWARRAVPS